MCDFVAFLFGDFEQCFRIVFIRSQVQYDITVEFRNHGLGSHLRILGNCGSKTTLFVDEDAHNTFFS